MSRKKKTPEAVPAEILAEGSGPAETTTASDDVARDVTDDAEVGMPVVVAEPAAPKQSKKRRGRRAEPQGEAVEAAEPEELAAALDDANLADAQRTRSSNPHAEPADADADDLAEANASGDGDDLAGDAVEASDASDTADPLEVEAAVAARADDVADELASDAVDPAGASDSEAGDGEVADGPVLPAAMDDAQLRKLVEALIFATDKPITLQRLRQLGRISDVKRIEQALAELAVEYQDRGIALHQVSGGYQFRTNTAFSPWVQQLIAGRPVRLSRAQLETLAIIAYRQPITRPEIDEIRGVDSSATLRLLLDRALVRVLGKREEVGRPILYGTTKEFLDFFSLSDLRELPTLREYSELTAESRQVMSDRLGVPLGDEPASIGEMGVGVGDIDVGIGREPGEEPGAPRPGDPADLAGSFPAASAAAAADATDAAIDAAFERDDTGTDDDAVAEHEDDLESSSADDTREAGEAGDDEVRAAEAWSDDRSTSDDELAGTRDRDVLARGVDADADVDRPDAGADVGDRDDDELVHAAAVSDDDDDELASANHFDELEDSLSARAARRLRELDERDPEADEVVADAATDLDEVANVAPEVDVVETAAELNPVTFDHEPGEPAHEPIDEPNE